MSNFLKDNIFLTGKSIFDKIQFCNLVNTYTFFEKHEHRSKS